MLLTMSSLSGVPHWFYIRGETGGGGGKKKEEKKKKIKTKTLPPPPPLTPTQYRCMFFSISDPFTHSPHTFFFFFLSFFESQKKKNSPSPTPPPLHPPCPRLSFEKIFGGFFFGNGGVFFIKQKKNTSFLCVRVVYECE